MPLSPDLPGSSKAALCVGPRAGAGPKGRALHRSLCGVRAQQASITRPREHPWEPVGFPSTRYGHSEEQRTPP
jgi:hypothetical protein